MMQVVRFILLLRGDVLVSSDRRSRVYVNMAWVGLAVLLAVVGWIVLQSRVQEVATITISDSAAQGQHMKMNALIMTYPIEEAVNRSELIAEITIQDIDNEFDEPSPTTMYTAEVNKVLKGTEEEGSIIRVLQDGTQRVQMNGQQVVQPGERYVLMLMSAEGTQTDSTYWILGGETGVYQVVGDQIIVGWVKREDKLAGLEVPVDELSNIERASPDLFDRLKGRAIQVLLKERFEQFILREVSGPVRSSSSE